MTRIDARVIRLIDGDTVELEFQLGFGLIKQDTARLLGVDTAETYGVSHDSKEYAEGMEHKQFVKEWLVEAEDGTEYPLTAEVSERGKYGRWLVRIENSDGECLNDLLLDTFDIQY